MDKAAKSGYPLSLLAALETRDKLSKKISKRPIVVIPGADISKVVDWEIANMDYGLQAGRKVQAITKEQYFG